MGGFEYVRDRLLTLRPLFEVRNDPLCLLLSLDRRQWMYFLVGFLAWTWDAFDFHSATIAYPELAETFERTATQISVGVTLVLMFRPLGAAFFGAAADRFGRKWPFIVNNALLIIFEVATGFCRTYSQFLVVRAMFGFAMGGMYGNAAATALEDCPEAARGLMSGIFQSGYPIGYLIATVLWKAFDGTTKYGWRALFWFGACPPVILIVARLFMAETEAFQNRPALRGTDTEAHAALEEVKVAVKRHWPLLLYLVLLMTGFNFLTHGTQDLFPLMLRNKYDFGSTRITLVQVTANLGAFTGGTLAGYSSEIFGRRFAIVIMCIIGGALLYPYTAISGSGLYAAVFFEQFCVLGAWGVVPIHLIELSPPAFRTFVVGTSYQLGNLVAAGSNSIETAIGERYPLPSRHGTATYDYSLVICIFTACAYGFVAVVTSLGPERRGATLGKSDEDEELGIVRKIDSLWSVEHSGPRRRF